MLRQAHLSIGHPLPALIEAGFKYRERQQHYTRALALITWTLTNWTIARQRQRHGVFERVYVGPWLGAGLIALNRVLDQDVQEAEAVKLAARKRRLDDVIARPARGKEIVRKYPRVHLAALVRPETRMAVKHFAIEKGVIMADVVEQAIAAGLPKIGGKKYRELLQPRGVRMGHVRQPTGRRIDL